MSVNTYSLISLDEVKDFYGVIGSTSEVDDLISELINRISTLFESYMNKNIISREYEQNYNGGGHSELFINQYPVTSVSGIWDDSDWLWPDSTLVDATNYRITESEDSIVFKYCTLTDYGMNVKIIYTAGYESVPEDIKHACIKEVARSYKNKQEVGVTSKTLENGSVSYSAQDLLIETKIVLDKYKYIGVC